MEAAGQDTMEASVKIRSWSEKEADFLRRTGLKKQSGSSQIPGFGRSQSGIASRKAEEYYAVWSKSLGIDDAIKTLAKYYDVKYNDSPRYEVLRKYVQSLHSGKLSPMSHFDLYELYYKEIQDKLIGCSVNGVEITSQSQHFLERVFGCMCDPKTGLPRNGAELQDVFDAVLHPTSIDGIKVDERGKRSFAVYGHRAKVTINPDTGMLIQTNRWRG